MHSKKYIVSKALTGRHAKAVLATGDNKKGGPLVDEKDNKVDVPVVSKKKRFNFQKTVIK